MNDHYRYNFENFVASITCACGEEHYLVSHSGPYDCDCGRRFTFSTKIIVEHWAKHIKQTPYWEDNCPVCDEKAIAACRCPLNDRKCPNDHWWRRDKNNEAILLTEAHGEAMSMNEIKEKYFPNREPEELREVGERTMHLERAFNVRHGLKPEDDWTVPERLVSAPDGGPGKGLSIKPYLEGMVKEHHKLMDWDAKTGKPSRATLKRVGLEDVVKDLWD